MKLPKELSKLFGPEDQRELQSFYVKQIHRLAWSGDMTMEACRGLCWRVMMKVVCNASKTKWATELLNQVSNYNQLKAQHLSTFDKASIDPLSALSTGDTQSDEWSAYYSNVDLSNFIKGDLDRLYLNGIDDAFFQEPHRRLSLSNILFIWSKQNSTTSYRQGMHEILGTIWYVIETEMIEWQRAISRKEITSSHPLYNAFNPDTVESHTYWIFEKIMRELKLLYDPVQKHQDHKSNQPFIVQFCTKIQEHYLRLLDPDLCNHLEDSYVQAQLYGMRWSRLMLGREFPVTHNFTYKLWDYMFASWSETVRAIEENALDPSVPLFDEDSPPNIYSMVANVRAVGYVEGAEYLSPTVQNKLSAMRSPPGGRSVSTDTLNSKQDTRSPVMLCTPLLGCIGDFMLAMLLHIREELMQADSSSVMMYLMRYPQQQNVTTILDLADMIRRGVIITEAHLGGTEMKTPMKEVAADSPASKQSRGTAQFFGLQSGFSYSQVQKVPAGQHSPNAPTWLMKGSNAAEQPKKANKSVSKSIQSKLSAVRNVMEVKVKTLSHDWNGKKEVFVQNHDEQHGNDETIDHKLIQIRESADKINEHEFSSDDSDDGDDSQSGSSSRSQTRQLDFDPLTGEVVETRQLGKVSGTSSSRARQSPSPTQVKLFAPKTWFPHGTRVQSDALAADAHGSNSMATSDAGANSAGISLYALATSQNDDTTLSAKSNSRANANDIGDRLLGLADMLSSVSHRDPNDINHTTEVHGGDGIALTRRFNEQTRHLELERLLRVACVERLRSLADVISGYSSLADYDNHINSRFEKSCVPIAASSISETVDRDILCRYSLMEASNATKQGAASSSSDNDDLLSRSVIMDCATMQILDAGRTVHQSVIDRSNESYKEQLQGAGDDLKLYLSGTTDPLSASSTHNSPLEIVRSVQTKLRASSIENAEIVGDSNGDTAIVSLITDEVFASNSI